MQYILTQEEMDSYVTQAEYDEVVKLLTTKNRLIDSLYDAIEEQPEAIKEAIFSSQTAKMAALEAAAQADASSSTPGTGAAAMRLQTLMREAQSMGEVTDMEEVAEMPEGNPQVPTA